MPLNLSVATAADKRHAAKTRIDLTKDMRRNAARFSEYDADGNQSLDWEEFYAMQPRRIRQEHSAAEIRKWFDAADSNGDGTMSINEFFAWSL